jgi:hypothetical protein
MRVIRHDKQRCKRTKKPGRRPGFFRYTFSLSFKKMLAGGTQAQLKAFSGQTGQQLES